MKRRFKVLHVANGEAGPATATVQGLKQWSHHRHEFVSKGVDGYSVPTLTEQNTEPVTVLELAETADIIHFHGAGMQGTQANPQTIHGIDWRPLCEGKKTIFHGTVSMMTPTRTYILPGKDRHAVADLDAYDVLLGSYPSCALSYGAGRMQYVPDIIAVHDWLLSPLPGWLASQKPKQLCTSRIKAAARKLLASGFPLHYVDPAAFRPSEYLRSRRNDFAAALDNYSDGHWTTFGLECLAQGVPCGVYISPENESAFELLGADEPAPFIRLDYGGQNLQDMLQLILDMPDAELDGLSHYGTYWMREYYDAEKLVGRWDDVYTALEA